MYGLGLDRDKQKKIKGHIWTEENILLVIIFCNYVKRYF